MIEVDPETKEMLKQLVRYNIYIYVTVHVNMHLLTRILAILATFK